MTQKYLLKNINQFIPWIYSELCEIILSKTKIQTKVVPIVVMWNSCTWNLLRVKDENFIDLHSSLSCSLTLCLFSLLNLPENKRLSAKSSASKIPLPFLSAPGYFYPLLPPPMPPPIPPSLSRELSVPICTLLVTLSTYLVPTECLCNQTNTYLVVRHSNGRRIMKTPSFKVNNWLSDL